MIVCRKRPSSKKLTEISEIPVTTENQVTAVAADISRNQLYLILKIVGSVIGGIIVIALACYCCCKYFKVSIKKCYLTFFIKPSLLECYYKRFHFKLKFLSISCMLCYLLKHKKSVSKIFFNNLMSLNIKICFNNYLVIFLML